jgi:hypothetical protein
MKRLLLLLFVSISFNSYATYLICDAGPQQWVGEADSSKSIGDAFEVQLLENNRAILDGLPFCMSTPIMYYTTDTHVLMFCNEVDRESVYEGSVSISRISGLYDYDFKVTYDGTMISWWLQKAKCSVAEKKLF